MAGGWAVFQFVLNGRRVSWAVAASRELLAVGVAELGAEQAGQRVQVAVSVGVDHMHAFGMIDDQRILPFAELRVLREVQHQVVTHRRFHSVRHALDPGPAPAPGLD